MKIQPKEFFLTLSIVIPSVAFVGMSLLLSLETNANIALENDLSETWDNYQESLSRENTLYEDSVVDERTIENLQTALDTALNETALIQTLLNMEMENWTSADILRMRAELEGLPYGSPFKDGHYVTGEFGSTELTDTFWKSGHIGVDLYPLSGNEVEPIISPINGRVVTWGRDDRVYGNYLVIETLDGKYQLKFAHLSAIGIIAEEGIDLYEGMEFRSGNQLARMGATGKVTGRHLHLEYHILEDDGSYRVLNASAIVKYIGEEK